MSFPFLRSLTKLNSLHQRITLPYIRILPAWSVPKRTRAFSTTMSFKTPSSDPPAHEMVYFEDMTTALPSTSGEFRRVLWTGLYSQLVLMTVPVDGEIGDEVRLHHR